MQSVFQVKGISAEQYAEFYELSSQELLSHNAAWITADSYPGYPCRVSLQDAQVGEQLLVLTHTHHAVKGPYQASGPIFIRKDAKLSKLAPDQLPECAMGRSFSVKIYNQDHRMSEARQIAGADLGDATRSLFENPKVSYLQVHNLVYGCYMFEINRV